MSRENIRHNSIESSEHDIPMQRLVRLSVLTGTSKELDSLFGDLKPAVIVADSDYKIVYLNQSSQNLPNERDFNPAYGTILMDYVKRILEPGVLISFYESILGKKNITINSGFLNKRVKNLSLRTVGNDGFIVKINLDELFTESASNLFRFFPGMPVTFFGFDLSAGKRISIRFVGENFKTLFPEIPTDELIETENKFIQFIHPEDLPGFLSQLQTLKKRDSFKTEFRFQSGNKTRWYNMYASRFKEENQNNFWLAYLEDKTERKEHVLEKENLVYETIENERQRIAMELHDNLGQNLVALNLFINSIEENKRLENYSVCQGLILDSISKMKSLCYNLTPPELENGLLIALDSFFGKLNELSKDIKFTFNAKNIDPNRININRSYNIFRIVQEFVSNSQKYSDCTDVTCEIFPKRNSTVIILRDNGNGFDINTVKRGYGLDNIIKRAKVADLDYEFLSNEVEGTCLILQLN